MTKKNFVIVVLASLCLVGALFATMSIRSSPEVEYDPWADIYDDGVIDVFDLVRVAASFGAEGTQISKASIEYDSGWINITDKAGQYITVVHNLNSTDVIVDITGKTTINGGAHQRNFGLTSYLSGWSRTYGGTSYEEAYSIVQTPDGGYALAGDTDTDFWLVKTDSSGNVQWNKTYGGTGNDEARSLVLTDDGYAIAGWTYSFGAGGADFWLVKTDWIGNIQWTGTYGETRNEYARSLVHTSDGGYAIAGTSQTMYEPPPGNSTRDFYLVKTDWTGNMEWNRTYDKNVWDEAHSVIQTSDGGYAIAGVTGSDGWLVKTDASGNQQWNRTYGGDHGDTFNSMVQTSDGGYALAGVTSSFGPELGAWLIKIDANGNPQWNHTYGKFFEFPSLATCALVQTSEGGYAIVGNGGIPVTVYGWLLKTDQSGNEQWRRVFHNLEGSWSSAYGLSAFSVAQTYNGEIVLAGYKWSFDTNRDFWFAKTDAESGLAWTDSTADTITLYRGATDAYWNYVRVRIWKIKETP